MMSFLHARERMVERQLVGRGITQPALLEAFRKVPREAFVPKALAPYAYEDRPLAIGHDQTISQPYVVALTIEALRLCGKERVLEVGTGSGYAAAILSHMAHEVVTIERIAALADQARLRLQELGMSNIRVCVGDGSQGWSAGAPYDAIAVSAAAPGEPSVLLDQLATPGRMVVPIGPADGDQRLTLFVRNSDAQTESHVLCPVRFVPLIAGA